MLQSCLAVAGSGGVVVEAEEEPSGRLLLWVLLPLWLVAWGRRGVCCAELLPAVAGAGNLR